MGESIHNINGSHTIHDLQSFVRHVNHDESELPLRATEEKLAVANRNDDFATKFYHQAHSFVNAYGFIQMDGFHCPGAKNGQCIVAQPTPSLSD